MFRTTLAIAVIAVAGMLGTQTAAAGHGQPDPWYAFAVAYSNPSFVTDTLAPGGTSAPVRGYRLITDTLAPGGGQSSVHSVPAAGFSWSDAGIGAACTAALVLTLMVGMRAVSRRRVVAA
jgi:hypothetical protein